MSRPGWNPALPWERRALAVATLEAGGSALGLDVPDWQGEQAELDAWQLERQWGSCERALRIVGGPTGE